MSKPISLRPVARSLASNLSASNATNSGAVAMMIAAREEATRCSPAAISGKGIVTSATANTASQRQ